MKDRERRLIRLLGELGLLLSLDVPLRSRCEVVQMAVDVVCETRLRGKDAGDFRVTDLAWRGFFEDVVDHGLSNVAEDEALGLACGGGDLGVTCGAMEGHGLRDFVVVDGLD